MEKVRKKFLIKIDDFDNTSGGIVAMHKLCNDINFLGRTAYVTAKNSNKKINAPFIGSIEMNIDEWVVIYPEIVVGNPYKFKHVARWILNTPGMCGGGNAQNFYDAKMPSDLIYKYSNFFKYDGEIHGHLRSTFIDYELFHNKHMTRDIDSCFFVKKNGCKKIIHPQQSIDFAQFQHDWHLAANVLNRTKYFYCYDNECFWVTIAALCGCIPIVIPNTDLDSATWKQYFPFNKCGVAFGIDEIDAAKNQLPHVENHCISTQIQDLDTVRQFIYKCDNL